MTDEEKGMMDEVMELRGKLKYTKTTLHMGEGWNEVCLESCNENSKIKYKALFGFSEIIAGLKLMLREEKKRNDLNTFIRIFDLLKDNPDWSIRVKKRIGRYDCFVFTASEHEGGIVKRERSMAFPVSFSQAPEYMEIFLRETIKGR